VSKFIFFSDVRFRQDVVYQKLFLKQLIFQIDIQKIKGVKEGVFRCIVLTCYVLDCSVGDMRRCLWLYRAHRWVIAAESEITLKLSFSSEDCGQFDQTLNFEIVGTRRRYQLCCRGVCVYPTVSREPRSTHTHTHTHSHTHSALLFFTLSHIREHFSDAVWYAVVN